MFSDSQVGVQIINKMATTKSSIYNDIFCAKNKIWITAAHISRTEDVIADYESRKRSRSSLLCIKVKYTAT